MSVRSGSGSWTGTLMRTARQRSRTPDDCGSAQSLLCSLSQSSGSGQGFQNVTACQVSPPLSVSSSCPSMAARCRDPVPGSTPASQATAALVRAGSRLSESDAGRGAGPGHASGSPGQPRLSRNGPSQRIPEPGRPGTRMPPGSRYPCPGGFRASGHAGPGRPRACPGGGLFLTA